MQDYRKFSKPGEQQIPVGDEINKEVNRPLAEDETETEKVKLAKIINCNQLNLRESESREAKILCILNKGDIVTIISASIQEHCDGWAYVSLKDGTCGYVVIDFIEEV